jgi:hypothetical protein
MSRCHPAKGGRKTHAPGPPTILTAIAGDGKAIVTWSFPPAGSIPVTGYYVTSTPGNITQLWAPGPLSAVVSGLTNGTSYTFTVTAINSAGHGPPSQPSNSVIPGTALSPTLVSAIASDSRATVSWVASVGAFSYRVTSSPGGLTATSTGTSALVSGLRNGTVYTFTVSATNIYGTGPPSDPSNPVTPKGVPGTPVVTVIPQQSSAVLTWSPPSTGGSPITKYTVTTIPATFTITTTNYTASLTGLTDGASYIFIVTATNALGTGPVVPSSSIVIGGKPGAPTNVVATLSDASANITWTAAPANGAPITKYTVYSFPGTLTAIVTDVRVHARLITDLTATISGLTYGVNYTFTVTATNDYGNGPASLASNSVYPIGLPGASYRIFAIPGDTVANLTWDAAPSNGSPITLYTITSNLPGYTTTSTGLSATISDLINGVACTFTVTATNDVGTGPASPSSASVTPGRVPDPPTVLSSSAGTGSATITWLSPPNNGSTIINYTVTSDPDNIVTQTTKTNVIVQGLTNGVTYTFTVTATNAIGTGAPSLPSEPVIPKGPPGAPTIGAISSGNGFVTLNWFAPNSYGVPISGYNVTLIPGLHTITTSATTTTFTGLENGINYVFSVNATNAYGTGPSSKQSSMIMPTGVPGAPRNPFAISQLSSAKVSWSAPRNNGGFPILYYTVTSSPDNIQATWSSGPLLAIVTGLTNGIAYSFTITATNSYGTGLPSSTSNSTIPGAPGAPTNVSATAGDGRVSLVWTDPSGNGNPIQYYTVYPTPNEGIVGTIINGAEDGGTSSCIVTGLRNGISYVFAVTASNILCTGDFSKPSNSVIPTKELTAPYAPINIVATSGSSQVILSWTDISNGGSPITSHTITGGGVPGIITTNGQNSSCLIKNLTNGATYIFGIRSINAIGTGPPGYSDSVIPSAAPGRPLNVVAIAGDQSSYISWINPHNNGNPILYYTVFSTPNDGVVGTITKGADGGGTSSCTYMGLSAIPYTFTVTATNSVGESQRTVSNSVTPTAPAIPPGPMTNVTAAIGFSNTATISWTVPTGPISSYTITSNPATTIQTAASNATSIIFTGLIYEVPYTFTVVANNTTISGTPGTSNSITLMAPVPGRPTLVSAALSGSTTSAIVSWAAAPGFVTGYTITSSPATTSQTAAGNATSMTFTGLTYGVSYTFTVVARNGSGPGFGSTPSNSITPMPVVPGSPTNVSAAVNNATSVLVTWAAASGYVTGYTITSTPATTSQTAAGNATSKMFTGLTTGVSYTFTVVATNMSGPGTGSAPSNSVTPAYTALTLAFNAGAITLPITGTNITVDFGSGPTASLSGTLASAGQVIINGTVTEFTSDSPWTGVNRLTRVLSWGNNPITNLYRAFVGATSLTSVPTTLPSTVTNTARMFASASAFNGNISGWDMTNVTDTNNMFILATSFTATGLNNWNMTNVTNMYYMFYGTSAAYTNTTPSGKFITNLSGWPSTAAHTQFFSPDGATASGGGTDTTLTDPHSPFNTNTNFTLRFNAGPITLPVTGTNITVDFGSGPTASLSGTLVTAGQVKVYGTITGFGSGSAWTGANLLTSVTTWGTSSITSLNYAFYNATNLTSVPATLPSTVTNLNGTFFGASIFNSTLSTWDVSRVTTMNSMFKNAIAFTAAGLDSWAPFSCTAMNNMFQGTSAAYTRTDATGTFITDLTGWPASPTHTLFFSPDGTDTSLTDPHSPFNDTYSLVLRLNVGTAIGRGGLQFTNLQLIDPTITIYWGDQYNNVYTQGNDKTHYYTPGVYILRIVGRFSALIWNQIPGAAYCGMDLVTHILRWNNDLTTISISESTNPATGVLYPGATNLVYVPPVLPTGIVNLDSMFNGATIFNQNISGWDVSTVTSMSGMFKGAAAFNQNISGWSTSACTNMSSMFQGATSFNQNISGWSITAVKNMSSMFYGATSFTAAGLSTWNPISSTDMHSMFKQTSAAYTRTDASGTFIPNLTGWPYTITNISFFFSPDGTTDTSTTDSHSPYYNRVPLVLTFNAGNITLPVTGTNIRVDFGSGPASSLSGTLAAAGPVIVYGSITAFGSSSGWVGQTRLTNVDSWGSGPLTNLSYAFDGATSLTSVPSTLPSTVINTSYMFRNTASFNGSGLNYWNPTNVTNMNYMFYMFGGYSGDNLIVNLGSWPATATHVFFLSSNGTTDTSETDLKSPFIQTSMILRFAGTPQITLPILGGTVQVDFGNGVTTSSLSGTVSGTVSIFGSFTQFGSSEWQGVSSLLSVDKWPSTLTRLSGAFDGATLLTSVPSTIPASVTSVQYMFRNATLFNQDISGWDVSHILNAESMFSGATSFNRNLSSWNVSNMTTMNSMFQGATSFTATGLDRWTPTSCNTITGMFRGTTAAYTLNPSYPQYSIFRLNLNKWQTQAARDDYKVFFLSYDGTNDSTTFDPNSPFYASGSSMTLTFSGTPTVTLPITGGTVYVDFGNGKGTSLTGTVTNTTIQVYGAFTGFGSSGWQGVSSLASIGRWPWTITNFSNAFNGATNLGSVPTLLPMRSNVGYMYPVTNTDSMFRGATSFSQDITVWTTQLGNVTNMNNMFRGASASYTNTSSSGIFVRSMTGWPGIATHVFFFSPDGVTDTTTTDTRSPFYRL